jgi:predicted O-linked N-acetylglucosamine transferase (SPINDLY family)
MREMPTQALLRERFARLGIHGDQLDLRKPVWHTADHQLIYNEIDVALDPFPYDGTTTTCEALWMGVPVVTLAGVMHAGRVGVSILTQVGLTDCIARDPEHYVEIAVRLAGDTARLTELRAGLREKMAQSPLMDASGFARDVETAYHDMWRSWCESGAQSDHD